MSARLIEVIETELLRRGEGIAHDPIRVVTQYWTPDGELLAEIDRWGDKRTLRPQEAGPLLDAALMMLNEWDREMERNESHRPGELPPGDIESAIRRLRTAYDRAAGRMS